MSLIGTPLWGIEFKVVSAIMKQIKNRSDLKELGNNSHRMW